MPNVTMTVSGLDKLKRDLDEKKWRPYLVRALRSATSLVRGIVRKYPPPRSQRNRRTGRLGRGWKAQVSSTGETARVVNPVRYAHIVHGGRQPSAWHRSIGWKQTEDLGGDKTLIGRVVKAFDEQADAYAREVNR